MAKVDITFRAYTGRDALAIEWSFCLWSKAWRSSHGAFNRKGSHDRGLCRIEACRLDRRDSDGPATQYIHGAVMRNLRLLDIYRRTDRHVIEHYGNIGDEAVGVFEVPSPIDHATLLIVASAGDGWDHVSVSRRNRCPNWAEMEHVKRLFFKDTETAMQLHVPPAEHLSLHPHCLHLWRPTDREIPRPPAEFVAPVLQKEIA